MIHSYTDIFGEHDRDRDRFPTWTPPTTCAVCSFKVADAYGFCWIHKTEYVVMTYRDGLIDALPIKQELRRRMLARDYSVHDMADVLGIGQRRLSRILSPRTVWLRVHVADFWLTKLRLDLPAEMWGAA